MQLLAVRVYCLFNIAYAHFFFLSYFRFFILIKSNHRRSLMSLMHPFCCVKIHFYLHFKNIILHSGLTSLQYMKDLNIHPKPPLCAIWDLKKKRPRYEFDLGENIALKASLVITTAIHQIPRISTVRWAISDYHSAPQQIPDIQAVWTICSHALL